MSQNSVRYLGRMINVNVNCKRIANSFIGKVNGRLMILYTVPSFSRRNLFILNKFLISGKILITCRELYFEVVKAKDRIAQKLLFFSHHVYLKHQSQIR